MKKNLPSFAFSFLAAGAFFKMEHWPGASILLLISVATIVVSAILEFTQLEQDSRTKGLQIIVSMMIITCATAATFKIFHWPGASMMVSIAFNLTIPASIVYFSFNKGDYRLSRNLTSGIFFLLLLLMIFFPGNPIGERANQAHQENTSEQLDTPLAPEN
jgi:hypothetical protein